MEISKELHNALTKYFSLLSHTGYKKYNTVYKLVVFSFIEELLYGPCAEYITEEDYNTIINAVYNLYGDCMLSYPDYKKEPVPIYKLPFYSLRYTEDGLERLSEDNILRVKA